jgi:hypothetical protein
MNRPLCSKFPKAWAVGHRNAHGIFDDPVEITEKIDGSQIGFGWINGKLYVRSKNMEIHQGAAGMFHEGYEHIDKIASLLSPDHMYYGEYLKKPKHNTLEYASIPRNHICLFGIVGPDGGACVDHNMLINEAKRLDIGWVPLLDYCRIESPEQLLDYMGTESYLGGPKIEGIVIKNYMKEQMIADVWVPFTQAKHVSESFKEKHIKGWKKSNGKGPYQSLLEQMRNDEARWLKAVQSLRDSDQLDNSPTDIGPLLKHIQQDFEEEESQELKEILYKMHRKEMMRCVTAGFPEWYKELLLKSEFEGGDNG